MSAPLADVEKKQRREAVWLDSQVLLKNISA